MTGITAKRPGTAADAQVVATAAGPVPVLDPAAALETTGGAAVVHLTSWTLELAERLSRHAMSRPVRLVPVREDGALTVIGPVLEPGARACLACVEYRRLATAGGRVPWQSPRMALAGTGTPAMAEAALLLAASLLEPGPGAEADTETDGEADGETDAETGGASPATVHIVQSHRATWSTHRVRPVGGCPVCRPLPADSPAAARFPDAPLPLPDPAVLRGSNDRTEADRLRAELYDERFGPVRRLFRTEDSAFALTTAWVTDGRLVDDGGYGRSADFRSSERVALFEGVERLAGMRPLGRRTVLRASFAELGPEAAVDPARLGLPDPAHRGDPASHTVPYHADLELDWVYGWSLTHGRARAVPEHVAYWDLGRGPGRARVVYESSNGCGLGNSPQEAALYGLFEVAERDAFLMAWYARTPLPGIALPADDPLVTALASRAALMGYRLSLLDATNDLGIPAVVSLCRYEGGHPGAPRAFLAAGAHHDPRAAIRSAVAEVVTNVQDSVHRPAGPGGARDPERLRPMLRRPELVVGLDDHVGLNTLPEAQPRLEFLFPGVRGDVREVPWQERWPGAPTPVADLTRLLAQTVARLAAEGLEVVVVTQDEPGIRDRLGLHCAKVIVPGTLPMTFGHVNRRTLGLPRLLEVPHRLGRTARPLRHDELPLYPHPFP
ncbi:TOMM precursor leader peptide-binding protein [Streptomyces flavotricini]|uniref:TOMM leader peptide-binding protein n=1 Tax=Streptomyces flavotricini TaxID=66888 RepID=A0ABS8EGA3_9ACTN|nr:TOMM precursor leader peptide-binding protein [Streptomyces flavotricini]MCC0100096.1 TOMM precursor leader peptide-binding protein [Streptomyces flavotricini]